MTPAISAIVITNDGYDQIKALFHALRAQTIRDRMEIVLVAAADIDLAPVEKWRTYFGAWQTLRLPRIESMAVTRTAGIQAATCPYVVFTEQHCFPNAVWAEAILQAFEQQGADVVGPQLMNANPAMPVSWANMITEYGRWLSPGTQGWVDALPGNNSAYRRDLLLSLGDDLPTALEGEFALHIEWSTQGKRFWLEPRATSSHVNMTRPWPQLKAAFVFHRPWADSRARNWSWARRLAYACAWPLVPFVRLPRTIRDVQRCGQSVALLPAYIPWFLTTLTASSFGEALGYLGWTGDCRPFMVEIEINRQRYIAKHDSGGHARFNEA